MNWPRPHNTTITNQIAPLLRVSWGRARCWHGETVKISLRSSYVLDGGAITLEIFAVGNGVAVDTIANLTLNGNTLDHDYVVNWKNKVVPVGAEQFEVKATLANPAVVSPASEPMRVDLIDPSFSA